MFTNPKSRSFLDTKKGTPPTRCPSVNLWSGRQVSNLGLYAGRITFYR